MAQLDTGPPRTDAEAVTRLRRSRQDRVVAGVGGGLGAYFGVDPVWFRLAFVVLAIGGGSGVLVYLLLWLLVPQQGVDEELAAREAGEGAGREGPLIAGVALIGVGLILLFNTLFPWFDRVMWPMVLIAAGLGLIYSGRRRER